MDLSQLVMAAVVVVVITVVVAIICIQGFDGET
jgi:hypothetical protein